LEGDEWKGVLFTDKEDKPIGEDGSLNRWDSIDGAFWQNYA
jgi:hypothetical protein